MKTYQVRFSRLPDAPNGDTQFIELEDSDGKSVTGHWQFQSNGTVLLHIPLGIEGVSNRAIQAGVIEKFLEAANANSTGDALGAIMDAAEMAELIVRAELALDRIWGSPSSLEDRLNALIAVADYAEIYIGELIDNE